MNKYYINKIKKLIEKNTLYEGTFGYEELKPYLLLDEKELNKLLKYIEKLKVKKWQNMKY